MHHLALAGGSPVRDRPYPPWPRAGAAEREALDAVLASGSWDSRFGNCVRSFEDRFAAFQNARYAVCVSSGETALRLILQALELPAGAEVVLPAYTFVASATAVLQAGGVPVLADVDEQTLCLDPLAAEQLIGPNTYAIMPVHLGGLPAAIEELKDCADRHGLALVEDAAQAWGARYKGRGVGALGSAGGFSFHATKNLTAGEGGLIATNDQDLASRCRSLANCGRGDGEQRSAHLRLGGNFRMTEFQGALLGVALDRYPKEQRLRSTNAEALRSALTTVPGVDAQALPAAVDAHAWHLLILRVRLRDFAEIPKPLLVEALVAEGIPASGGYDRPIYSQPLFDARGSVSHRKGPCPVSERACLQEAIWIRQQVLLGDTNDALDVARAFEKLQRHRSELRALARRLPTVMTAAGSTDG